MKTLIIIVCLLAFRQGWSQPDSLSYENTQDLAITSELGSYDLRVYRARDGTVFRAGSPLILGRPSTNSGNFTYLYYGKLNAGNAMMGPPKQLVAAYQAERVVIEKIKVGHTKMSKKSPMMVLLFVENPTAPSSSNNRSIYDYEKALQLGEVINPAAPISREEAIRKLKESKDLLDLGMLSQGKYDSIKAVLSPVIMKGN